MRSTIPIGTRSLFPYPNRKRGFPSFMLAARNRHIMNQKRPQPEVCELVCCRLALP